MKKEVKIMDTDSTRVSTYFRRLNIGLLVINIIMTLVLSFTLAVAMNDQTAAEPEYNVITGRYGYDESKNEGELDSGVFFLVLFIGASWTILEYFIGLLIIKHFENVAETKELTHKQVEDLAEIKILLQQLNKHEEYQRYTQNQENK